MLNNEPILTAEDERRWDMLKRTALIHVETSDFNKALSAAKNRIAEIVLTRRDGASVSWSAGKDSTALVTLVAEFCHEAGVDVLPAMSLKDDLDFPGEVEYVKKIAQRISVELTVISPGFSLVEWVRAHADDFKVGEDIHSRSVKFSRRAFYDVIHNHQRRSGIKTALLGLRADEGRNRARNAQQRGWLYTRRDGITISQPIFDWSGLDVFAYLFSRGIEPLHVYRCLRFHKNPWDVRKSWWLPGASAAHGSTAWLKEYYPSLFNSLLDIMPAIGCTA